MNRVVGDMRINDMGFVGQGAVFQKDRGWGIWSDFLVCDSGTVNGATRIQRISPTRYRVFKHGSVDLIVTLYIR